jgi:hypothetical protein
VREHSEIQLSMLLNHSDSGEILACVRDLYRIFYDSEAFIPVTNTLCRIMELFRGEFPGYQGCNTEYHDVFHTLDIFLTTSRLMDGRNLSERIFPERLATNLLLAALLHDTGYIQDMSDTVGTGARHTKMHVERSMVFVRKNAAALDLPPEDIETICRLIHCTGLQVDCSKEFQDPEDTVAGSILGTADLLGQMSDRTYLEKLIFLYYEFREAGFEGYETEFDILRKTLVFYEFTMDRLNNTLLSSYRYGERHFEARHGIKENLYLKAINLQVAYLKEIIRDESTNFRSKLRRVDLEAAEAKYKAR